MTKKGASVSLLLVWIFWAFFMIHIGALAHLDWLECMRRSDGTAPKGPRIGEDGTFGLIIQAAQSALGRLAQDWLQVFFYVPIVLPALLGIALSKTARDRKLQVLFCSLLLICIWGLSWLLANDHDCDRKGVGFLFFTLSLFGFAPALALTYLARRL